MGSSVVDLRCLGLDPNKPITVDPHVVRGQQRVFPAQVDPATFQNANYNKGFEALMRFDVASAAAAVQYFEQAQKERPNDPLVRNALLLAQDIHTARQQKEKDDQKKAAYFTLQSYASLMMGDMINARYYIAQARQFDPSDNNAKVIESLSKVDLGPAGTYPGRKDAYQLVANSLVSIYLQNYPVAIDMIEAAQRLQPEDKFIGMFLREMRKYEAGRTGK
jgi:tetratricopeptide (TPR) repeat protein